MLVVPGIGKSIITDKLVSVAQTRADCIALLDIEGAYVPATENKTTSTLSVASARANIRDRKVNTSYAATFFPWVKVRNPNGTIIPAPATVAAVASFSRSDRIAGNVWYAPAGFTRGRLDVGSAELGLDIVDVVKRLSVTDRDDLYEVNINPIAKLPEGIVLFGQKTLQLTPSALDRINVRRLMNYIKREISFMASTTLFDPNTEVTWKRFTDRANPFLQGIVSGQGLAEYRLVLDNTTTTPDLVDRNVIYAKVVVKPVRAAEFFAIDFTIVRSDATL
jgi:phage tail sheath protein FI